MHFRSAIGNDAFLQMNIKCIWDTESDFTECWSNWNSCCNNLSCSSGLFYMVNIFYIRLYRRLIIINKEYINYMPAIM